ncbi:MAG: hypothetical protein R3D98_14550 [Candidatus Krumholzibacteriia bacterium]
MPPGVGRGLLVANDLRQNLGHLRFGGLQGRSARATSRAAAST